MKMSSNSRLVRKIVTIFFLLMAPILLGWLIFLSMDEKLPRPSKISESHEEKSLDTIRLSERARKLAKVVVIPIVRAFKPYEVRLYGRIDYDETTVVHITAWVPGRIEKLHVNFTGMTVNAGDPMAEFYSPRLIVAQEELLGSLKSFNTWKNTATSFAKDQAERNLESARTKLRLLGILTEQIEEIEKNKKIQEVVTIYAPVGGVVIARNALEGEYVNEGTEIFRIADLSEVWAQMEAYESDLPWLKLGQKVVLTIDAYPGRFFTGKISFIDPFLDKMTRTASVRVIIDNEDQKLKPGMYATAMVTSYITASGKISENKPQGESPPLIIPSSAPLITGKRAIVYVQNPKKEGEYQLREIILGPRLGDYYIVKSGLKEGEFVVAEGNFMIDSAAQIEAMPSMMMPEGGVKKMKGMSH